MKKRIIQVALPVRLRKRFDYLLRDGDVMPRIGARVLVPLQKREVVGVVCGVSTESAIAPGKIREISRILDAEPALPEELFNVLSWASRYYHHPVGEVMQAALPVALRRDRPMTPIEDRNFRISKAGREALADIPSRSYRQRDLLQVLIDAGSEGLSREELKQRSGGVSGALSRLMQRGWVEDFMPQRQTPASISEKPELNTAQQEACKAIKQGFGSYTPYLLDGVTGSGKTEVYLACAQSVVERGQQALILVPEISLTPQLISRFRERIQSRIAVLHSGLTDKERHLAWWQCRTGEALVILGTRSAIFAPFRRPGLIIVDEEHDLSYKQKDGFRYSARDMAVKRAQLAAVPVILGSATPSLESLANALGGRYVHLRLPKRAAGANLPQIALVDMNHQAASDGLSPAVVLAIKARLAKGEQTLVFVNRRGFAPVVGCVECGWQAACRRCDALMTLHRRSNRLICHHCGSQSRSPEVCPDCEQGTLYFSGEGTQRVEQALAKRFPDASVARLDSDAVPSSEQLQDALNAVREGHVDILVGTQMLSKGHDFEGVTLVCVLNADQNLFSADFRGPERLFQQLTQVAGRAGRRERVGEVLIQTAHPQHEALTRVVTHDFTGFAESLLAERRQASYPPFSRFALLRAESPVVDQSMIFLSRASACAKQASSRAGVQIFDPTPSPMERRAGRYRAQLLVTGTKEKIFHQFLSEWLAAVESLTEANRVRWSVDIDPQEMF